MIAASPGIDERDAAPAPPWAIDDPGMARAVGWYEANRHREDLPMLLRVMELEVAARKIGPPTKTEPVPPRIGAVEPDILSLTDAAEFVGMSAVWLRKHFRRLPEGIVIQRARRCAVNFRRDSLREWRDNGRGLGPLLRKGRE